MNNVDGRVRKKWFLFVYQCHVSIGVDGRVRKKLFLSVYQHHVYQDLLITTKKQPKTAAQAKAVYPQ